MKITMIIVMVLWTIWEVLTWLKLYALNRQHKYRIYHRMMWSQIKLKLYWIYLAVTIFYVTFG